jgi:hypothetical protein
MATFADPPECAAMYVVPLMTPVAIRCQRDLGNVLGNVAGMAIEATVRAGEGVACLRVVIKPPSRPAIGVVAERAIRSSTPLMMLVAMAGCARQRRILKPHGTVAFLACHDGVAS